MIQSVADKNILQDHPDTYKKLIDLIIFHFDNIKNLQSFTMFKNPNVVHMII